MRRSAAEADEDSRCTGLHEMASGAVGGDTAHEHRGVEAVDEVLEIQRILATDVLGRDRRAADDEEVHASLRDDVGEFLRASRRQRTRDGHIGVVELLDALLDQLALDRFRVDLLQDPGRRELILLSGDALVLRRRILVTGP